MHKRKLNVGSVIGTIILGGLMIALMIYTATRTVDFLQMTFPKSMSYVAYLALAAFDGGIIGWTIFATSAAEGAMQRGLAYLMIFVDTAGVILTTIADTTTISAQNGLTKVDPNMATVGMWGSICIIVLNVVAVIVTHLVAPHHVRKFELENVHDSIHQLTMQHIRTRAIEIAPQIAAEHADHWVRTTIQDVVGSLPASAQTRQLPSSNVVDADPPTISHNPVAKPMVAASKDQILDPEKVKPAVDSESKPLEKIRNAQAQKSLGEKIWAMRDAIDTKLDGKKDESEVLPVEQPQEEKPVDKPKLPSDPARWSHKHWMIAHDILPWKEYRRIFDEYRGDEPEKEYIVKPITEERPGHDPRTRRLGGDEEFEDQEDDVNPR